MNIIFLTLTFINAIVFIYAIFRDIQYEIEHKTLKKAFLYGINLAKKIEENIKAEENKANKTGMIIGTIIAVIGLILVYGGALIVPIILGFKINAETAIAAYLIILLITTIPHLYRIDKKDDFNVKQMILVSLIGLFKFQMIVVVLFGFNFSLESIVIDIYASGFYLSNTLTILTPILFFSSIIITIYLYWKGLVVNAKLPEDKKKKPRLSDALLILVICSVVGLIVLFEMNVDTQNNPAFDRILNLVLIILGSILIPSLFSLFNKKNNTTILTKTEETIETNYNRNYREEK